MTEEEALDILVNSIADYVIGEYCEHCADFKICKEECYYQQAIDKVAEKIQKQDTEINKLNNVIDRMAQELSNYAMDSYSCSKWCKLNDCNNWSNGYCIENELSCIKEYFMKEDK